MRIGLSYDLKEAFAVLPVADDALEEYDSPETVDIIARALECRGHEVIRLGGGVTLLDSLRGERPDIVFNIAEGRGSYRSREAQVPCLLEMLDIPYTGSDPTTLAVCLDKPLTKKLATAEGIPTPRWRVFADEAGLERTSWEGFPFPAIVKPACEGSSKGIRLTSLVEDAREAEKEINRVLEDYRQPVMVEEFIDGDEVTVGVIGNAPPELVGMMRILPKKRVEHFVYSVEVKRDYVNLVDYESPPQLAPETLARLEAASLKAFGALGCRDFARIDFRIGQDGMPYFIEINPLPGLGTYSDLVIMATMLGWTHDGLIGAVLEAALERYRRCPVA
jgi:D-alanine-D-alanine ligase